MKSDSKKTPSSRSKTQKAPSRKPSFSKPSRARSESSAAKEDRPYSRSKPAERGSSERSAYSRGKPSDKSPAERSAYSKSPRARSESPAHREERPYARGKPSSDARGRPSSDRERARPQSRLENSQNPRKLRPTLENEGKKTWSQSLAPRPERPKKEFKREKEIFIWGRRTVESYMANLHEQENIDVAKYTVHIIVDKANKAPAQLKPLADSAKVLGIKIVAHSSAEETWPLADTDNLNHQRVCLKIPEFPVSSLEEGCEILQNCAQNKEHGCIGLVLDQVQDPRNFGAILRSAAFFGVKFVVYATDRQAEITGLVLKTSAGGAFSVKLIPVVNINRALVKLKDAGGWIAGTTLDEKSVEPQTLPTDRSFVLVLGNEEKGLRSEVTKNCDYLVKLPGVEGSVDSLNVSVAAGIFLHALKPKSK